MPGSLDFGGLPGGALIAAGIEDLAHARQTVAGLTVAVGAARLRRLGLPVPPPFPDAELCLYRELIRQFPADAYSRYNALLRQLASFAGALEREQGQALRARRDDREP